MKKILLIIWIFASFSAVAEDKSPGEKMMLAIGIDKVLEAQREAYRVDAQKQVTIVMKQLEGILVQLPDETGEEIESIMTSMMATLLDSWDVETAVRVYSEEWNKNYTPTEIQDVIDKYEDPSAKKELEVVMASVAALNQYISGNYNAALERSMAESMSKIQQALIKGKKIADSRKPIRPPVEESVD